MFVAVVVAVVIGMAVRGDDNNGGNAGDAGGSGRGRGDDNGRDDAGGFSGGGGSSVMSMFCCHSQCSHTGTRERFTEARLSVG